MRFKVGDKVKCLVSSRGIGVVRQVNPTPGWNYIVDFPTFIGSFRVDTELDHVYMAAGGGIPVFDHELNIETIHETLVTESAQVLSYNDLSCKKTCPDVLNGHHTGCPYKRG